MKKYLSLKRANQLRLPLVPPGSREQIAQITRELKCTSWDACGAELACSALIGRAVEAEEKGRPLFETAEAAKAFADRERQNLKKLTLPACFLAVAPFFFFLWALEGLLVLWAAPQFACPVSLGYLAQFAFSVVSGCVLARRAVERGGFPPQTHRAKFALGLAVYIAALYGSGWLFHALWGGLVFFRVNNVVLVGACLLLGAAFWLLRLALYEKDPRLRGAL